MPSKSELLNALTVSKLRALAKENNVSLVFENWLLGDTRATSKEDIVEILSESRKISKKKIEAKMGEGSKKSSKKKGTKKSGKRRSLMTGEKTQIKKRQKYKCAKCGMDISKLARVDYDHIKPIALGGDNSLSNFQALCPNCHAEKTQMDRVQIAKAKKKNTSELKPERAKKRTSSQYKCKLSASDREWQCGKKKASKSCLSVWIFWGKR